MDNHGYWYKFFAERHDFFLYLGFFSIALALFSILRGKVFIHYRGPVSKSDDPKTFWQMVRFYALGGAVLIGLYFFGPS